jgi:hypothetical protein
MDNYKREINKSILTQERLLNLSKLLKQTLKNLKHTSLD